MKKHSHHLFSLLSLGMCLVIWESVVRVSQVEPWILPGPSQTLIALGTSREILTLHAVVTLTEAVTGFFLGFGLAFAVAMGMYFSPLMRKMLHPLLIISQTIPFIALAPLLVVWFGFGLMPKILIVALVCFFPIVVNAMEGFTSVDTSILRSLKTLGTSRWQLFKYAVVPSSLPFLFTGLKIAGTYALLTAMVAEWIGASSGLGIFITRAAKSYLTDQVFAAVVVISVMSLVMVAIIGRIYAIMTPYRAINN